ncbi:hypothetical protein N0V84_002042 [Fusarium piperis]|uniref:AttH domain-containing protein n=1 Tax=Fusarium piperis TaxID=1435070 RepID=A0A9W9BTR0_9HYPO|nr:hypothetical protein N0V84_002042 [Fusarium piperis]
MRFNLAFAHLSMALGAVTAAPATMAKPNNNLPAYSFRPEADESYWKSSLPVLFNFSTSQFDKTVNGKAAASSYWTSSFLTGHNKRQYLAISHAFTDMHNSSYYRSSVLDLNDLEVYHSKVTYSNDTVLQSDSLLKLTLAQNGFESTSVDNVSQMRTWSNHGKVKFNIKYNATSSVIVDGGMGLFTFGNGLSYEWGLPSCRTEGSVTLDGHEITIDPSNSFTWYDRQWNDGLPVGGNWTWFQLHLPNSRTKFSIWAIEDEVTKRADYFTTIRLEDGSQNLVPVTFLPDYTRQWHSPASGFYYPQDWTLIVGDYATLRVSSATKNQEIVGNTVFSTAYEGFVTFDGEIDGQYVDGYGVVEVLFTS